MKNKNPIKITLELLPEELMRDRSPKGVFTSWQTREEAE